MTLFPALIIQVRGITLNSHIGLTPILYLKWMLHQPLDFKDCLTPTTASKI